LTERGGAIHELSLILRARKANCYRQKVIKEERLDAESALRVGTRISGGDSKGRNQSLTKTL